MTAINLGDAKQAGKILSDDRLDISNLDKDALNLAFSWGSLSTTRLLLKRGADVDIQDQNGNSPLINASISRNSKVAKKLVFWLI